MSTKTPLIARKTKSKQRAFLAEHTLGMKTPAPPERPKSAHSLGGRNAIGVDAVMRNLEHRHDEKDATYSETGKSIAFMICRRFIIIIIIYFFLKKSLPFHPILLK